MSAGTLDFRRSNSIVNFSSNFYLEALPSESCWRNQQPRFHLGWYNVVRSFNRFTSQFGLPRHRFSRSMRGSRHDSHCCHNSLQIREFLGSWPSKKSGTFASKNSQRFGIRLAQTVCDLRKEQTYFWMLFSPVLILPAKTETSFMMTLPRFDQLLALQHWRIESCQQKASERSKHLSMSVDPQKSCRIKGLVWVSYYCTFPECQRSWNFRDHIYVVYFLGGWLDI